MEYQVFTKEAEGIVIKGVIVGNCMYCPNPLDDYRSKTLEYLRGKGIHNIDLPDDY